MEYLKDKINKLATNSQIKNIRNLHKGIYEFKRATNQHHLQFCLDQLTCVKMGLLSFTFIRVN
jgi:hypothetical protein